MRRHPVYINKRSAAAPLFEILLAASSLRSTAPSRSNSCSDRKRSQLRDGYFLVNRHGLPPGRASPDAAAPGKQRDHLVRHYGGLAEHLFALEQAMQRYDFLTRQIDDCEARVMAEIERLTPPDDLPDGGAPDSTPGATVDTLSSRSARGGHRRAPQRDFHRRQAPRKACPIP